MDNQVRMLRTRVELPQFDFTGLPQIPPGSSYAKRLQGIKLMGPNTFVIEKNKSTNATLNTAKSETLIYKLTEESVAHRDIVMNRNEIALPELRSKSNQSIGRKYKPLSKSLMLRITHAETELDVLECIVGDKDLDYVDENELILFENLYYIDVSGNYLPFDKFAVLSSLRDLNIGCNALNKVTVPDNIEGAFSKLEVLNISYNTFSDPYLFHELGKLKSLKKLDLSGNNLQGLPNDLSHFKLVEIILEDNVLDHGIFVSLSSISTLVVVNLNKNKIERIPRIRKDAFQNLKQVSLQENFITFHEDLYLMEFMCLEVLDVFMNPISTRPKDVERAKYNCEKKSINLLIDNSIQLPSSKVPVSQFYKKNQVININKINKKSTPQIKEQEPMTTLEFVEQEETQESSFFITAVPRLDLKAIQKENNPADKILTPKSPFRSPTTKLFSQQSTSEIKKITESYDRMKDIGRKVNVTYDVKDFRQNSKAPADRYEFNKDWFDLDVALSNIDDSMDDEIKKNVVIAKEKQNLNLYNENVDLYRTNLSDKKNTYRALKFAIENPLNLPTQSESKKANRGLIDTSTLKNMYH